MSHMSTIIDYNIYGRNIHLELLPKTSIFLITDMNLD